MSVSDPSIGHATRHQAVESELDRDGDAHRAQRYVPQSMLRFLAAAYVRRHGGWQEGSAMPKLLFARAAVASDTRGSVSLAMSC